jgi:hypothetical protein
VQPSSDNPFYIPTPHRATYTQPEWAVEYWRDTFANTVEKYALAARAMAYQKALNDAAAIILARRDKLGSYQLGEMRALSNVTESILDLPNPYTTDAA